MLLGLNSIYSVESVVQYFSPQASFVRSHFKLVSDIIDPKFIEENLKNNIVENLKENKA